MRSPLSPPGFLFKGGGEERRGLEVMDLSKLGGKDLKKTPYPQPSHKQQFDYYR